MKTIVRLTNRTAEFERPYPYEEINELLKYRKPGWDYTPSGRAYVQWRIDVEAKRALEEDGPVGWDGYLHLLKGGKVGAGVFLAMREKLEEVTGGVFVVDDVRKPPKFRDLPHGEQDRDYQIECFEKMQTASKTGGLILNATGSGKTYIAGKYFKALVGHGLFVVDELALMKQAQAELSKVIGEAVGEIGNGVFNPKRITVATIQTLHRHRLSNVFVPWTRLLQTIIIDEVHLALNRSNFQTVAAIRPPTVFGLTATLELRKKSVSMRAYDLCGPVVFEYPLSKGVAAGVLSKGVVVQVNLENKYKGAPVKGWSYLQRRQIHRKRYQEEYVSLIVDGFYRNNFIVEMIGEAHSRGKYTILLVERIAHLKKISEMLGDLPHHLVFGEKKVDQRMISKLKFELGNIRVLLVNKVFQKERTSGEWTFSLMRRQ